jgi:hypothetical protein
MKCVAEKSDEGENFRTSVNQTISMLQKLSQDELDQTCTLAIETSLQNKKAYTQIGCSI